MRVFVLHAIVVGLCVQTAFAQVSGSSPTCGDIAGKARNDLSHVRTFCEKAVPKGLGVVGARANEMLLWIAVGRDTASAMCADKLTVKQIILSWMNAWKAIIEYQTVTIRVEWGDVRIAEGQTTVFSGDKVTFSCP